MKYTGGNLCSSIILRTAEMSWLGSWLVKMALGLARIIQMVTIVESVYYSINKALSPESMTKEVLGKYEYLIFTEMLLPLFSYVCLLIYRTLLSHCF